MNSLSIESLSVMPDGSLLVPEVHPFCEILKPIGHKIRQVKEPGFVWTGGKIPISLWRKIISFFLWSQEKYKSESLVQLFYNPETKEWAAWAFPQRGVGMTVSHMENDPRFMQDRAQFPDPWCSFGSVHHHCTSKAFASSTDAQDELRKEGLHITVGELDKALLDLHWRVSFKNQIYSTRLRDWFSMGTSTELGNLDERADSFFEWVIKFPHKDGHPKEWEERFCNTWQTQGQTSEGGVTYRGNFTTARESNSSNSTRAGSVTERTIPLSNIMPLGMMRERDRILGGVPDVVKEEVNLIFRAVFRTDFDTDSTTLLTALNLYNNSKDAITAKDSILALAEGAKDRTIIRRFYTFLDIVREGGVSPRAVEMLFTEYKVSW